MKVYFDSAATTQIHPEVIDEMVKLMRETFGNPSSTHIFGRSGKALIENARKSIAQKVNVSSGEIIFTSCGTEANNLIIRSCVESLGVEHIITSPLEHKCVALTTEEMKNNRNVIKSLIKIKPDGDYDYIDLERKLEESDKKTLVSLMHANNELGNIYDVKRIATICKKHNALFHSDMVQTLGHFPIDLQEIGVDFASSSAHKYHGPKGVGFAYIKRGSGLRSQITGGGQERNMRSGTENVHSIVGMRKAFEMANQNFDQEIEKVLHLKKYAKEKLQQAFPQILFNGKSGDMEHSLYTLLSLSLPFKDGLIGFELDLKGIGASQGSACSSGAAKSSAVLSQILSPEIIASTTPLRISFSIYNTTEEIDYLVQSLKEIETKQRKRESKMVATSKQN